MALANVGAENVFGDAIIVLPNQLSSFGLLLRFGFPGQFFPDGTITVGFYPGNPNGNVVGERGSLVIDTATPGLWQAKGTGPFFTDWNPV